MAMPIFAQRRWQNQGITIRKRTPDSLMVINFISPDGRYDDLYLSNYATINVRDEVLRVDGVSDVNIFGQRRLQHPAPGLTHRRWPPTASTPATWPPPFVAKTSICRPDGSVSRPWTDSISTSPSTPSAGWSPRNSSPISW